MTPTTKAYWQMHFCVLLWGFTAILGKVITLPAMALVVWRMAIVALALLLLPRVWRGLRALPSPSTATSRPGSAPVSIQNTVAAAALMTRTRTRPPNHDGRVARPLTPEDAARAMRQGFSDYLVLDPAQGWRHTFPEQIRAMLAKAET